MLAAIEFYFTYPDTGGKTLEEIEEMFAPGGPKPWKTKFGDSRLDGLVLQARENHLTIEDIVGKGAKKIGQRPRRKGVMSLLATDREDRSNEAYSRALNSAARTAKQLRTFVTKASPHRCLALYMLSKAAIQLTTYRQYVAGINLGLASVFTVLTSTEFLAEYVSSIQASQSKRQTVHHGDPFSRTPTGWTMIRRRRLAKSRRFNHDVPSRLFKYFSSCPQSLWKLQNYMHKEHTLCLGC